MKKVSKGNIKLRTEKGTLRNASLLNFKRFARIQQQKITHVFCANKARAATDTQSAIAIVIKGRRKTIIKKPDSKGSRINCCILRTVAVTLRNAALFNFKRFARIQQQIFLHVSNKYIDMREATDMEEQVKLLSD